MGWECADAAHYPEERKVARADEWGGLESRCGLRVTMGSNPIPSAKSIRWPLDEGRHSSAGNEGIQLRVVDEESRLGVGHPRPVGCQ